MPFNPIGVVVMISGPGDTIEEVAAVREVIAKWNNDHGTSHGIVFIAKHYSTDAVPLYRKGTDGQTLINEQITQQSDVVLCLFKYRLGTKTPNNAYSGTVEEADLREAQAHVHMYFCVGELIPRSVVEGANRGQWDELNAFRESFHENNKGLYDTYDSTSSLCEKVNRALWADATAIKEARAAEVVGQSDAPKGTPAHVSRLEAEIATLRARLKNPHSDDQRLFDLVLKHLPEDAGPLGWLFVGKFTGKQWLNSDLRKISEFKDRFGRYSFRDSDVQEDYRGLLTALADFHHRLVTEAGEYHRIGKGSSVDYQNFIVDRYTRKTANMVPYDQVVDELINLMDAVFSTRQKFIATGRARGLGAAVPLAQ